MTTLVRMHRAALVLATGVVLAVALGGLLPQASAAVQPAERSFGSRAMAVAARYEGVPYAAGGTTPRGFDCSGFTRYVYARLGKHIPRISHDQFRHARKVGRKVSKGELIFFRSGGGGRVYHVGIYAGRGRIWHAPRSGERVRLDRIWTRQWTAGRY